MIDRHLIRCERASGDGYGVQAMKEAPFRLEMGPVSQSCEICQVFNPSS